MKKYILVFIAVVFYTSLFSQPAPIIVTILASQPVTGITNIQYEFSGTFSYYDISVEVSFDGSAYQPVPAVDLSGDLDNVTPGIRNIEWNGAASFPNYYHEQTRIRITATPTWPDCGQITDIDGNVYNTVLIGTQCWMKENLKTTRDADGNDITRYCHGDNPSNCNIYGGLYTWWAAMNGASSSNTVPSGVRGICPFGWHVASDAEWDILVNLLGGASVAGGKMKETGYDHWISPNTGATNESGFTALPGDNRTDYGLYHVLGIAGYWWTSTEVESFQANYYQIFSNGELVFRDGLGAPFDNGFSVRCLQD